MALTLSPSSPPPALDEPALVAATRAGDDRAFEALYARYRERIFAFILGRVHAQAPPVRRSENRLQAMDLRDRQERLHR
jgi:hypothetical protein